jgi:hypothetical protein
MAQNFFSHLGCSSFLPLLLFMGFIVWCIVTLVAICHLQGTSLMHASCFRDQHALLYASLCV